MGWGDSALFMKISLILLIVTLIIQILGVALPYWYSLSVNNGDFYGGLWRNCGENDATNYKACSSPTNVTGTSTYCSYSVYHRIRLFRDL